MDMDQTPPKAPKDKKVPYPTIYCDEELFVADISPTAKTSSFSHLLGMSLKEHLSPQDTASLLSYLHSRKRDPETPASRGLFVDISKVKGVGCAYVTVTFLFKKPFFEMRIFRSRLSMFKDFDVSRLLLSDMPYVPDYDLSRNRLSVLDTGEKLTRVFSAGRLKNLYHSALDPMRQEASFDAVATTRRIIADLPFALDLDRCAFSLSVNENGVFGHRVIDVSNYVNLVAILMTLTAKISATGKVSSRLTCSEKRVSLVFTTEASPSETAFVGGFAFPFLAQMYPRLSSFVWAAQFVGELFGLRCYAELSGKNTLSVELLMKASPPDIEIGVMVPAENEYQKLLEDASAFTDYFVLASEI